MNYQFERQDYQQNPHGSRYNGAEPETFPLAPLNLQGRAASPTNY
ncbi:hypothetical protein [Chlorogloeopsis fritschii]|nr:hypothetical protein [Chlorogloeopsis fritschii]